VTLREGLQEYFAGHSGLLKPDSADVQTAKFFHSHDACHVLFGLDTTLRDEGLADLSWRNTAFTLVILGAACLRNRK
jgi:hypothetical protein